MKKIISMLRHIGSNMKKEYLIIFVIISYLIFNFIVSDGYRYEKIFYGLMVLVLIGILVTSKNEK